MKLLRVLCVLALALCVTASVYAETQSVKVSGDLTMRGIYRNQYALLGSENESFGTNSSTTSAGSSTKNSTEQGFAMTVAAVQVDADLTDNVTTVIRILNQRDWNVYYRGVESTTSLVPNGRGLYYGNGDDAYYGSGEDADRGKPGISAESSGKYRCSGRRRHRSLHNYDGAR